MNKEQLEQLSDEELRASFRKHNINGIIISLALLGIFLLVYFIPLGISPELMYYLFLGLIVLSAGFGLWYNFSKRKYFKEFRERDIRF
ncbi:hypothetical protein OKW21_002366 [Catalinimonas alkaloidigena]|uniref:hypothetical protein n=1 Tax=Catalinimonas alkaloidigena TaxID=1075417 RepID=UPI00240725E9|nr:hypothetical protein [Catalinimonas alkaloidigena]MDF9797103.1 hypothetical protein [Catalinimonas alkaloidigena]